MPCWEELQERTITKDPDAPIPPLHGKQPAAFHSQQKMYFSSCWLFGLLCLIYLVPDAHCPHHSCSSIRIAGDRRMTFRALFCTQSLPRCIWRTTVWPSAFKGQTLLPLQWHKVFPKCIGDNFLAKVIKELTRGDALLDLIFTNGEGLGWSDHETEELGQNSRITTLDLIRSHFDQFRGLRDQLRFLLWLMIF